MLVPLILLQKFFAVPPSFSQIIKACEKIGVEIEKISLTGPIKFENIFTAVITDVVPHPNADKLKIAKVSDGKESYTVVCGAQNCRPGLKTALAKPGAVLHINDSPLIIKKSKIRGVDSEGMLCSADELSLINEKSAGIIELSENLPLGEDYSLLIGAPVIEIALTPNLGHCCSLMGLAREIACILSLNLIKPDFLPIFDQKIHDTARQSTDDNTYYPIYVCAKIENLPYKESPGTFKELLVCLGIKPVNFVVDVTNFIMFVTGQPLHAFDAAKVDASSLRVEQLQEPQSIILLNQQKVVLKSGTLVVKDNANILALAGIMGTAESAISPTTSSVLLESAFFSQEAIRKTENHLQIHTDSSYRFSRGTNPAGVLEALQTALALILKYEPGVKIQSPEFKTNAPIENKFVILTKDKVNTLLNCELSSQQIGTILEQLNFKIVEQNETTLKIQVPSYRHDILEDIDLVEEVSRIIGISQTSGSNTKPNRTAPSCYNLKKDLKSHLISAKLQEFYTCDILKQDEMDLIPKNIKKEECVFICTSKGSMVMRPALLPGLLQTSAFNIHRGSSNIRSFEIGRIYGKRKHKYSEEEALGILVTGLTTPTSWQHKERNVDFYDLKGILENIFHHYSLSPDFEPSQYEEFHPYQQADIFLGKMLVGKIGSLHPEILEKSGIKQPVFFAECLISSFLKTYLKIEKMQAITEFPSSTRSITLSLKTTYPCKLLTQFSKKQQSPWLESVMISDLYQDPIIGNQWKNVTLKMVYRSPVRNLSSDEIEEEHQKLISRLIEKLKSDEVLKIPGEGV